MKQKVSTTRIFDSFAIGEKTIAITILLLWFITFVSFTLSLSSYFMTSKNTSVLNNTAVTFDYGNKYSYDSCFTCTPAVSSSQPSNIDIKSQFVLNNPNTQSTFLKAPITFGNVFFPQVNYNNPLPTTWSNNWFNSKIRLAPNSNIVLTGLLKTNSINSLQIGYFDYINNQTSICTTKTAQYGSVYFAIDPVLSNHYVCICVMNPQFPVETCSLMSVPSF